MAKYYYIIFLFQIIIIRFYSVQKGDINFDSFGHLYFSKQLINNRLGPYSSIPVNVIGVKEFNNPFFYNWLAAKLFGLKRLISLQKHINNFLELLALIIYSILVYLIFEDINLVLISACLYLSMPLLTKSVSGGGPRLYCFTPRIFSELIVNLYFLIFLLPQDFDFIYKIGLCSILALMVISSSKFGLQAILFLSVLISILAWSLMPIIPVFVAIILLILLTKKKFLKQIKDQFTHLSNYYETVKNRDAPIRSRSNLRNIWYGLPENKNIMIRLIALWNWLKEVLIVYAAKKGILAGPLLMPILLPIVFFLIYYGFGESLLSIVVLSAVIIYLLVNIPRLLFLGESERYLTHTAYLLCLFFVINATQNGYELLILFILGFNFFYLINQLLRIYSNKIYSNTNLNNSITAYFEGLDTKKNIICFPYHIGSFYSLLLKTEHNVFGSLLSDFKTHPIIKESLELHYPHLDLNRLNYMRRSFGVDTLILYPASLQKVGLENWKLPAGWEEVKSFPSGVKVFMVKPL